MSTSATTWTCTITSSRTSVHSALLTSHTKPISDAMFVLVSARNRETPVRCDRCQAYYVVQVWCCWIVLLVFSVFFFFCTDNWSFPSVLALLCPWKSFCLVVCTVSYTPAVMCDRNALYFQGLSGLLLDCLKPRLIKRTSVSQHLQGCQECHLGQEILFSNLSLLHLCLRIWTRSSIKWVIPTCVTEILFGTSGQGFPVLLLLKLLRVDLWRTLIMLFQHKGIPVSAQYVGKVLTEENTMRTIWTCTTMSRHTNVPIVPAHLHTKGISGSMYGMECVQKTRMCREVSDSFII